MPRITAFMGGFAWASTDGRLTAAMVLAAAEALRKLRRDTEVDTGEFI
jgi:hypothetical protein